MSGPICPDCTTLALIETKGHFSCPICGWSGDNPPRKIMDAETSWELGERTRRLMALRLDNQLRFVRVDLVGDEDVRSDAVFDVMELFGVNQVKGDKQIRFFVEGRVVDIEIDQLSKIPGVGKVTVF